jgi:DNA-binding transcriptional ArsR family regulator
MSIGLAGPGLGGPGLGGPGLGGPGLASAAADQVFAALADPTRRQLLELLGEQAAASATTLAGQLPVSRQAVVKHLAVLQQSDLVTRRRDGREVVFTVHPEQLVATASWMTSVAASWQQRLRLLKQAAEAGGQPTEAGHYPTRPGGRPGPP